jgi:hypothetical protein
MKVVLARRRYGVHETVKVIPLPRSCYVRRRNPPIINEDALLEDLPKGFLPCSPSGVLLMLEDKSGYSATAVGAPKRFRKWGKYFECYSLTVERGALPGSTPP